MSRFPFTLAVILALGLPLSSQSFAAQVTAQRDIAEPLPFEIPSLRLKGTVRAAPGDRLYVVTLTLGDDPVETDVSRFVLVTSDRRYEPIGAGGRDDIIIPLDRVPLGREIGEILPSDAVLALTRTTATRVTLEVGPRGTLALLYELPAGATVRSLRLPDGRELTITP
jgi:hypothetical protein